MEILNKNKTRTRLGIDPFISKIKGDCNVNLSSIYSKVEGNVYGGNGALGAAVVNGDVHGANGALGIGAVNGDVYGANGALGIGAVNGDVHGANGALGIGAVNGDVYGANGALGLGAVNGDVYGANGALGLGEIDGTLNDTILQTLFPKLTKYLPKCVKEIAIPGFNVGVLTTTGNTNNAAIFGFYNIIKETDGDYVAFGLINQTKNDDGKYSLRFLFDGKITIDGIFRHRKSGLEEKTE